MDRHRLGVKAAWAKAIAEGLELAPHEKGGATYQGPRHPREAGALLAAESRAEPHLAPVGQEQRNQMESAVAGVF